MNYLSQTEFVALCFGQDEEIIPGVKWGRAEWVPSPAYWATLAACQIEQPLFRKPNSLAEEIGFCLLGGYGITAEVNCAAFRNLKSHGMFESPSVPKSSAIEKLLRAELSVGKSILRYRFPKQRAQRLSGALERLNNEDPGHLSPSELRGYLLTFDGIGPKTASWITRNWMGTDDVAIIDIHVHRAGLRMGLFSPSSALPRDYFGMEERFLEFANRIAVRASVLDVLIWSTMRKLGVHRDIGWEPKNGQRRR